MTLVSNAALLPAHFQVVLDFSSAYTKYLHTYRKPDKNMEEHRDGVKRHRNTLGRKAEGAGVHGKLSRMKMNASETEGYQELNSKAKSSDSPINRGIREDFLC